MCASSSQSSPSFSQTVSLSSSLNTRKTQNSSSSKINPPKHLSTINNSSNLLNHPQLTFSYPPSASSLSPSQLQPSTCSFTQSSFHHSPPSQNSLRILQRDANGIRPCRTELIQFLSLNQYNLNSEVAPLF